MSVKKIKLNLSLHQISILENAQKAINKNIIATSVNQNPKIRMAQVGGPAIIGERISNEPIMDRFGDVVYLEGRRLKATSFIGEIELSEIEKQNLKNFNEEI
ncbi:hypothetical protein [Flavobacterium koreense]